MATRRQMREWAVQLLFQLDMNPGRLDEALERFWEEKTADTPARMATADLVRGVSEHRAELDGKLAHYAENWDLARMGGVERNVLRLGLFEMLYREDIPPVVSINEAVDVAKYFSTSESGRFVNGILDRARKELKRAGGG
jgi:N utilization substance protein B